MKTKKALIVLGILIVALAAALYYFSAYGNRNAAPAATPNAPQTPAANAQTAAPVETLAPVEALAPPSEQQVDEKANAAAKAMLPVMDAGIRAMRGTENGMYAPEDPAFVWSMLYHLCVNADIKSDLIDRSKEDVMIVPKTLMQELASTCFAAYSELPDLPKDLSSVSYDKKADAYTLELSDSGDAYSELMRVIPFGEEGYTAFVAFLSDAEPDAPLLSTYVFDIKPNAYIDGAQTSFFPMSVSAGANASNVVAQITGVREEGGAVMLDIHHVQLFWKQDEEDGEVYVPAIVADTQPDETLRLSSLDAVDWNTTYALITGGKEAEFKGTAEESFAWFKENFARLVDYDPLVYQMRAYDGVIYEMTPLYQFYFAG